MDNPPYSRLFVACSKNHSEEELRSVFSKYGDIESLYVVKDQQTKESRGIAFVKYRLSSSAALAQENLDRSSIGDDPKPVTVCIATSKNNQKTFDVNDTAARSRLYVILPKGANERDLEDTFSHFADYESSYVIRDKSSSEHKGFGFVCFSKASSAALAVENCNGDYRAVIAEPKDAARSRRGAGDLTPRLQHVARPADRYSAAASVVSPVVPLPTVPGGSLPLHSGDIPTRLFIKLHPLITQDQLQRLCDIPPGLVDCRLIHSNRTGESRGFAFVTYNSFENACYAKEKLHNVEYPPGSFLTVKFAEDPPKSTSYDTVGGNDRNSARAAAAAAGAMEVVESENARVFFVCSPTPPPIPTLRSVFSQFGNLERLWLVGEHNYGFGLFSEAAAASLSIEKLNGAVVGGCRLKVLPAEPLHEEHRAETPDNDHLQTQQG